INREIGNAADSIRSTSAVTLGSAIRDTGPGQPACRQLRIEALSSFKGNEQLWGWLPPPAESHRLKEKQEIQQAAAAQRERCPTAL
ncbi:MAG: hypothetical protein ACE5MM_04125, partial [Nitrospiraceae bacterium]